MSRCVLDNEEAETEVVIGWDPGAGTFFARVFDHRRARAVRSRDPNALYEDAGLVLWITGYGNENYQSPEPVISMIKPYASSFDEDLLRRELLIDKASGSDRIYSLEPEDLYEKADEGGWDYDEWEKVEQEDLAVYTGPKNSERITAVDLRKAFLFLIRIEPEPSSIQSMEEYRTFMAPHDGAIKAALSTIRRFAEQLEPKTIEPNERGLL